MEVGPVFGLNIGDLLEIYDRDSQSWKMSGCLFTGDYGKSSGPLPKSGMMQNGKIYGQATWVRRIGGRESGLFPSPCSMDGDTHSLPRAERLVITKNQTVRMKNGNGTQSNLGLSRHVQIFPTQQVALRQFPTPHTNCHTGPGTRGDGGENLQTAVMWPTPQQRDWKGKSQRGADPENRDCLPNAVMNFPTPSTMDHIDRKGMRPSREATGRKTGYLSEAIPGQLNPTWVDWLMGYPVGWTDLKDSEMQLSLK